MRLLTILFFMLITIFANQVHSQNFWEPTNGPLGGRVLSFTVNNNNELMVGSEGGGIFRRPDLGTIWDITGLGGDEVVLFTTDSNGYILAGTQYDGLFRSPDGGYTWFKLTGGILTHAGIQSIAINSGGALFIGVDIFPLLHQNYGIYRSTDNGASWENVFNPWVSVHALAAKSDSAEYIFAATAEGLFRSTDNGGNWAISGQNPWVSTFLVHPSGHIFGGSYEGVYRSSDNGETWNLYNNGLNEVLITQLAFNSSGDIIAGTFSDGIFLSADMGENWAPVNTGLPDSSVVYIYVAPDDRIFTVLESGVFVSVDNGNQWTALEVTLSNTRVNALFSWVSDILYAGTEEGIYRSVNNGQEWLLTDTSEAAQRLNTFADISNGYAFAGGNSGVLRSTDQGNNWMLLQNELTDKIVSSLAVNAQNHIFAGTSYDGVFRSTDNGEHWDQVNNGLIIDNISALVIQSNSYIFVVACCGGRIYRSTDNGENWQEVIFTGNLPRSIVVGANDHLFAGVDEHYLYQSTDNGETWDSVTTPFKYAGLAVNSNGGLFASTWGGGVYRSTDNGETWSQINSGLDNKYIRTLEVNSQDFIFAGTSGNGVYRSIHSTTGFKNAQQEIPANFALEQNYPNPFNPETVIRYHLPMAAHVQLTIYNSLGKQIRRLVEGWQTQSTYQIRWDGRNDLGEPVSSGLYFYRLRAGDYMQTRKMLLLK